MLFSISHYGFYYYHKWKNQLTAGVKQKHQTFLVASETAAAVDKCITQLVTWRGVKRIRPLTHLVYLGLHPLRKILCKIFEFTPSLYAGNKLSLVSNHQDVVWLFDDPHCCCLGDLMINADTVRQLNSHSSSLTSTYAYHFTQLYNFSNGEIAPFLSFSLPPWAKVGAFHSDELPFVFGSVYSKEYKVWSGKFNKL